MQPWSRRARRAAIAVLGCGFVALGLVMIVTPGPAVLVVPAGLALLATEFERPRQWREAWLAWIRRRRGRTTPAPPGPFTPPAA